MENWKKDQEIIDSLAKGDESQLEALYKTYRNEFLLWSQASYSTDYEVGKDVFQEALIDLYRNVKNGTLVRLTSSLKTYLFQLGKYKLLNQYKHDQMRMRHLNVFADEFQNWGNDETEAESQLLDKLNAALEQLPSGCHEVITMYYFEHYSMESIAREMAYKNSDTAKSKKAKCMKALVSMMKLNPQPEERES